MFPATASRHPDPDGGIPAGAAHPSNPAGRFDFDRDTFAFANELWWQYVPDPATGRRQFRRRDPAPTFAHRCFALVRAARLFLDHARFEPGRPRANAAEYARLTRIVLRRSPLRLADAGERVVFPGYASLREFSHSHQDMLRSACGGAWRSYVLRSHWRMVFPISRRHQASTATRLSTAIAGGRCPIVHLVRFPQLTINHGMLLFAVESRGAGLAFTAYDPNDCDRPSALAYDPGTRTFMLPANRYWAGGRVDVIEIYRNWWF